MYVFFEHSGRVSYIFYEEPPKDLLVRPYLITEQIPKPESKPHKIPILMCDGARLWYEYEQSATNIKEEKPSLEDEVRKIAKQSDTIAELVLQISMTSIEPPEKPPETSATAPSDKPPEKPNDMPDIGLLLDMMGKESPSTPTEPLP